MHFPNGRLPNDHRHRDNIRDDSDGDDDVPRGHGSHRCSSRHAPHDRGRDRDDAHAPRGHGRAHHGHGAVSYTHLTLPTNSRV